MKKEHANASPHPWEKQMLKTLDGERIMLNIVQGETDLTAPSCIPP